MVPVLTDNTLDHFIFNLENHTQTRTLLNIYHKYLTIIGLGYRKISWFVNGEYLQEEKQSVIFTKSDFNKEKSVVSFTLEQNIICSQTKLDDSAHQQTIIWRHLRPGLVSSQPMKRRKYLQRIIMSFKYNWRMWMIIIAPVSPDLESNSSFDTQAHIHNELKKNWESSNVMEVT